jgi:hypothetical protein
MHHFKYNIEKKEILAKRQAYIDELTTLKNDLEKLTNTSLNEISLIQKLKEANEILNELTIDNYSEFKKQESQEWIDIKNCTKTNSDLYNRLLLKKKDNRINIDSVTTRIIELEKIIELGDLLYEKLEKLDDILKEAELKKDYRPVFKSDTINQIDTIREPIIIKCFTKGMLQPFGYKNAVTHFEYLYNYNQLVFQNEIKVEVDNDFFKKLHFICDYLDLNKLEKYKEEDNCYFPISFEVPNNFDMRTDVGFDDNSFEFQLSIINYEIHESYNGHILNCPFRLRLLIDFILSYNN